MIAGTAAERAAGVALARDVADHLRALLRDVICGHLTPTWRGSPTSCSQSHSGRPGPEVEAEVEPAVHGDRRAGGGASAEPRRRSARRSRVLVRPLDAVKAAIRAEARSAEQVCRRCGPARRDRGCPRPDTAPASGALSPSSSDKRFDGRGVATHEHVEVGEVRRHARAPARSPSSSCSSSATCSTEWPSQSVAVHAIDDQPAARHARLVEAGRRGYAASTRRLGLGRGHDQETSSPARAAARPRLASLAEPVDHARQRAEEPRQLADHVDRP